MKPIHMIFGIVGAIAIIFVANSAFIVTETDRALVLSLGKVDRQVEDPGLYFRRPFIQQLVKYDDRVLDLDSDPEEIVTKDKKRLVVDTFMRWRIADATKFYETQRSMSGGRTQLNTIMSSATKRSLARHDAQDIISGERQNIMTNILAETREEASRFGIEVIDVRIKRADLPPENSQAVYNRMRAERNKEAKEIRAGGEEEAQKIRANAERERTVLIAEAENQSQMLRGSGDAEAIKIFADAFGKSPEFYRLTRTLEAYRNSLAKQNTMLVVDPETSFLQIFEQGQ